MMIIYINYLTVYRV